MMIDKLVLATHNEKKVSEIKDILDPYGVEIFTAAELGLPDVEETGTTFEENAKLKAETLSEISKLPCLADDSGFCVNALGGAPGVYSARYANRDWDKGINKIWAELEEKKTEDYTAYFQCVLALAIPNLPTQIFEGRVNGKIIKEKRGLGGFGYDPVFVPDGYDKTFAEMNMEEKGKISHRGISLRKFAETF